MKMKQVLFLVPFAVILEGCVPMAPMIVHGAAMNMGAQILGEVVSGDSGGGRGSGSSGGALPFLSGRGSMNGMIGDALSYMNAEIAVSRNPTSGNIHRVFGEGQRLAGKYRP
jgi:hypothetical protein